MRTPALLFVICACGHSGASTGDGAMGDVAPGEASPGDARDGAVDLRMQCNVRDYGAVGDGSTDDTAHLQAAADACANGGHIVVSAAASGSNTFLTGTWTLHGTDVELTLGAGTTILGIAPEPFPDIACANAQKTEYPAAAPGSAACAQQSVPYPYPAVHCAYADGDCHGVADADLYDDYRSNRGLVVARDIAGPTGFTLDGTGTIDGQGRAPIWRRTAYQPATKVEEHLRPYGIWVENSGPVTVRDVSLVNAAVWGLVIQDDSDVTISHVTIDSWGNENQDGIDIYDSSNVAIDGTTVVSGDDGICFKSSDASKGIDTATVTNTTVTGRSFAAGDTVGTGPSAGNGLKFGKASAGPFANVTFGDGVEALVVTNYRESALELDSVNGAAISNIHYNKIRYAKVGAPIYIALGSIPSKPSKPLTPFGSIDSISFTDIAPDGDPSTAILGASGSSPGSGAYGSTISGACVYGPANGSGVVTYATKLEPTHITFSNVQLVNNVGIPYFDVDATKNPHAEPPETTVQLYAGYPDPKDWRNLPARGLFLRHASNLSLGDTTFVSTGSGADTRPAVVSVDVTGCTIGVGACPASVAANWCPTSETIPTVPPHH